MFEKNWAEYLPAALTICDEKGHIVYMNKQSDRTFEKYGGAGLLGKNLFDCHPEDAGAILREMFENRTSNCYTVEKEGRKKLIYQAPWYNEGRFSGFVEISIELPENIPHINRDKGE